MFKIIKPYIKSQKAFTSTDLSIALIILMLFVSVIGMIIYNIYISSSASLRSAYATGYAIDIIERIDNTSYEELNQSLASSIISDLQIPQAYSTNVEIQKYNELPGNENKEDLIKIVNLTITYKIGNRNQVLEISRLKLKR